MRLSLLRSWKGFTVLLSRSLGALGEDYMVLNVRTNHSDRKVGDMKLLKHHSAQALIKEATELYSLIYDVECFGPRDLIRYSIIVEELHRRGIVAKESNTLRFVQTDKPKAVPSESYATEVRRER